MAGDAWGPAFWKSAAIRGDERIPVFHVVAAVNGELGVLSTCGRGCSRRVIIVRSGSNARNASMQSR